MIVILAAYDDKRVIGNQGKIPWHVGEDLQLFKKKTEGHWIVMGRKTWESLPIKPLPKRLNIVLTREMTVPFSVEGVGDGPLFVSDFVELLNAANRCNQDLFVIGGAKIYELALKLGIVDKVIVSKIQGSYSGDVYFPILPDDRWTCTDLQEHKGFQVLEYVKSGKKSNVKIEKIEINTKNGML